jgi:hypothetical protein
MVVKGSRMDFEDPERGRQVRRGVSGRETVSAVSKRWRKEPETGDKTVEVANQCIYVWRDGRERSREITRDRARLMGRRYKVGNRARNRKGLEEMLHPIRSL